MAEENDPKKKLTKNKTMVPATEQGPREGESQFLKFQDKNGDMLPDVCVDVPPPIEKCRNCVPNPYAIISNWRERNQLEPILNEKSCKYQITMVTPETTTGFVEGMTEEEAEEVLKGIFKNYAYQAVQILLEHFQKDDSAETVKKIMLVTDYTDYYLEARTGSRLKLLYSIDFDDVDALPPLPEEEADDYDTTPDPEDKEFVLMAKDVQVNVTRLRKTLDLYNRYLKVFRATEGGNLKFKDDLRVFNLGDYGDDGLFGAGILADTYHQLDNWLAARGFTLGVSFFDMFSSDELITKMEMHFTGDYKIKKLRIFTEGCRDRPAKTYRMNRLASLRRQSGWRDKTAVAYFAQQNNMMRDASSRRPMPWIEFLEKYTVPEIFAYKPEGPIGKPSISDCINANLENEFKELGQDIFDEVFSIGDAIAKQFHDTLCRSNPDEVRKDLAEMGLSPGASFTDIFNQESQAQMQQFFTVDEKDPIFVNMCKRALLYHGFGGMGMGSLDSLYRHGLGPMKYCGLFDLLFEAMECLFKGLTLGEALGRIVLVTLKAMGVEDFGALFVGLPPEKRAELDALVRKNLKSGKMFEGVDDKSPRAQNQDAFFGGVGITHPWDDDDFVERQRRTARPGPFGGTQSAKASGIGSYDPTTENRTLADKLGGPSSAQKGGLDPNVVLEAYVLGLVEVYEDNYLALLDHLSSFPGAQLISAVIALFDCPSPPLFNPSIMDFIKSLTMPFCSEPYDIVSIRMENPFRAWPKLSDILGLIFALLKKLLIMLLVKILLMILAKICEVIGNAICKALETVGAVAGSLPELLSGRESLYNVIRDSICGPQASISQIEETVVSLVDQFGVGGAALADRDTAINFFADAINSMTREEMFEAFVDGPSSTALDLIDNIIEYDYPEYRDAFPSKTSIGSFFKNVGVLMPAQVRSDMRDVLEAFPEEAQQPANPTLCATPEEIQRFEEQRCALLEGRMSPAQCAALNESAKEQLLDDLEDIGNTLQMGIPNLVEANMPPVFSDPGCENGLLPYEPEELKEAALLGVEGGLKKMEATFTADMLGEGGFFSKQKDWGFMNMCLSDTYGNPWTVHQDKVAGGIEWVSYYGEPSEEDFPGPPDVPSNPFELPLWLIKFVAYIVVLPLLIIIWVIDKLFFSDTRGAYPKYVGGFLRETFNPLGNLAQGGSTSSLYGSTIKGMGRPISKSMEFKSVNDKRRAKSFNRSFDRLGFVGFLWDTDVELVDTSNYGYNVKTKVNFGSDTVKFTKLPRKNTPDISLAFRDNAKGYYKGANALDGIWDGKSTWGFGYQVNAFYADLYQPDGKSGSPLVNRPDDNTRVEIMSAINLGSAYGLGNPAISPGQQKDAFANAADAFKDGNKIIGSQRFEFLSVDDSLTGINLFAFERLNKHFERFFNTPPQVAAIMDLVDQSGVESDMDYGAAQAKYDRVTQQFYTDFSKEIYDNSTGWLFGASFPNYSRRDFEYGVTMTPELAGIGDNPDVGEWCPYWKLEVKDDDNDVVPVWMTPGFLGISYNQHIETEKGTPENTKIFYLEPGKYGGSYVFPPVYAKPPPNTGWVGMIDVMFPERSPSTCKNKQQGIIGFDQVQEMVRDTYASLSEDSRLTGDPDCTRELPFDRILPRTGKSAIRGLIMGGIRCFGNVEILRALGTFATFAPDFENNYSKIFSGYIVESMQESCMTTGGNFLNPFNDNEFWYAFLEMSVQFYIDRLDDPNDEYITLDKMPDYIRVALEKIDRLQKSYKYPWDFDDFNSEDYGTFESMKSFRESKNLEAVKRVESEAKLILQELVQEQLIEIGKLFIKNSHRGGIESKYKNMNYYFFNKYCAGGQNLKLHGEHKHRVARAGSPGSLPAEAGVSAYTTGDMLSLPNGDPYVGEYHSHMDVDGEIIYMVGAEHSEEEEQDRLIPFAENLEIVTIKKIVEYDDSEQPTGVVDYVEEPLGDIVDVATSGGSLDEKEFYLKKHIIIDGDKHSNADGVAMIRGLPGNISTNFPGTMELVLEDIIRDGEVVGKGKPIGVSGRLGVQYQLEIGMLHNGREIPVAETRVDALDLPCSRFKGIEPNSAILLCLINQLQDSPRYKFLTQYIFSIRKSLSLLAIYNSIGLTPSIGEWTTESGTLTSPTLPTGFPPTFSDSGKPGLHLKRPRKPDGSQGAFYESVEIPENQGGGTRPKFNFSVDFIPGWLSEDDRNGWFSSFGFLDYDEWDQEILRKTTRYMKNAFRTHYRNRKWSKPDYGDRDPVGEWIDGIVNKFRFNSAYKILPSFQKKQARGNPFDAEGNECKKG